MRMKGGRKEGLRNSISEMEKKKEEDDDEGRRGAGDVGPLQDRPRRRRRNRRGSGEGGGGRPGDRRKFARVDGLVAVCAFVAAFVSVSAGKQPREGGGREEGTEPNTKNAL